MSPLLRRLSGSWVARGLGAGAATAVVDHSVGLALAMAGLPTRAAATGGKVAGALFSYVAHRRFTFRDHRQPLTASGARYALVAVAVTAAHGQVVVWLRDGVGLPYLVAAVLTDGLVVTPSWLVALRFFVFPAARPAARVPPIDPSAPGI
ncbi:MAG: GtrA family protein [Myxococcaceae bacterium]|nr:GtrA family protein [Myxococcaceae bacterium]